MPFFRIEGDLHYFANVPRCGGASVEAYLHSRFGPLAFLNAQYRPQPEPRRWTKSSPQHVDWATLTAMVPRDWIASAFAVVRHPTARLVSAYHYQKEVERQIPLGVEFDDWFADFLTDEERSPFAYDNHLRPQSQIVPDWAAAFQLEAGLEPLVAHLDTLAGDADGPRALPRSNERKSKHAEQVVPGPRSLELIAAHYAEDFRRYGYEIDRPDPVRPPLSAPRSAPAAAGQGRALERTVKAGVRRIFG